ncbi:hypothetical protein HDV00_006330 [Rhizophlyctis rosea]|nr:hypothetical protein HDV00_006330 [Rhizophlyctis rosea]
MNAQQLGGSGSPQVQPHGGMVGAPGAAGSGMMLPPSHQQQQYYQGGSDPEGWKVEQSMPMKMEGPMFGAGGSSGASLQSFHAAGSGSHHGVSGSGPLPTLQPLHQLHSLRPTYPTNSPQFNAYDHQSYRPNPSFTLNPSQQHHHQQQSQHPAQQASHLSVQHQQHNSMYRHNPTMFNPTMESSMRLGGGPTLPSLMDPDMSYPNHLPPQSFEGDSYYRTAGPADQHFLGSVSPNTVHAPSPTFSAGNAMQGGPSNYHPGSSSANPHLTHPGHQHHPHPHDHLPSGPDQIVPYTPDAFKHSLLNHRFEDKDLALDFIKDTAKKFGFSVLVRTSKPDYVVVICNCGRRLKKLKNERKRNRKFKTAMTGCGWRVVLFRNSKRLFEFRGTPKMEHNHPLPVEVLPMV